MNKPILISASPLTEAQQDCVGKLQEALDQAKAGNVYTVGIVVCMKTGYAATIGGTDAGSLNLGCDSLKRRILDSIEGDIPTKIMRPGR